MIEQEIMKQIKKDGILHKHNYGPYINLEKYYNLYDKFCIVHATGTGKSYLSIQLMYDILRKKEDSKFLYTVPANNIKKQIVDEINQLPLANEEREKIKRSIEFITYQALSSKNEEELKNYDLCIVDEFQHLGADKWSRNIKKMEERGIKILGLSATPIREEYTSTPENVAETFFDGNVASYYDIVDAWIDKVLPVPIYKASKIELLERCEKLKNKVDSSNVSEEEREKVYRAYNKIKTEIKEEHKMPEDIIRNNIKKDGKYIYFCSTIQDLMESKESFLNILTEDEKQNVEIYEIYSGYKEKENNEAHYNFVNNKTKNKEDANKKLRVMFSIDMYTEGVHIKDVDGVIMGRGTKSYRVFNQQIGRALGVKTDKTKSPLIIDLAGNIYGMRNLLRKLDERIEERKRKGKLKEEDLDINLKYILTEEEIEVLNSFEKMSKYIRSILDIDMPIKIEEFIEKVDEEGFIAPQKGDKIQNTRHINNVGMFWNRNTKKEKICEYINLNEEVRKKYPIGCKIILEKYKEYQENKNLGEEGKILEFIEKVDEEGFIAPHIGDRIQSTNHINNAGIFWNYNTNKEKIYEYINQNEEIRKKYPMGCKIIVKKYKEYQENKSLGIDGKILEFIEKVDEEGFIAPNNGDKIQSTNHINNVGMFWNYYKVKIYEYINQNEEIRKKYPMGCKIIVKKYKEYQENKSLGIDGKILEFIEKVDKEGFIASKSGDKVQSTEHINNTGIFWTNSKEKIYKYINQNEELQKKFPVAYKEIVGRYKGFDSKLLEFIEKVDEEGFIASQRGDKIQSTNHINNVGTFWNCNTNKEKIYEYINQNEEVRKNYPTGYKIILEKYKAYLLKFLVKIDKWDNKKQTDNIKYICDINNIDYDKNVSTLKHVTYKEFVSKIEYLKACDQVLVDDNGILHNIFNVSSDVLASKYNITMEKLIEDYFVIPTKTL